MRRCIDSRYGDMLYAYELGMLSDDEKAAFEQHLIKCEFCSLRAEKNLEIVEIIRNDPEIHEYTVSLGDEGVNERDLESRSRTAGRPAWKLWSYSIPVAAVLLLVLLLIDWQIDIRPTNEVVAADNRLVILYFDNVADPSDRDHLSDIATNLLITSLGESKYLRVISNGYMLDLATTQGLDRGKIKNPGIALDLAREARATWILTGELLRLDSGIIITSQLADVATGNILSTQRVTGGPDETIFSVIDKLSAEIRRDVPLPSLARDDSGFSVSDITTHSAEAFRHYLNGVEFVTRFYVTEGISEFEQALEHDSTFAMAYYYLSRVKSKEMIELARKYSKSAGSKERQYIESQYNLIHGDTARAISLLQNLINDHPDEPLALCQLGFIQRMLKKPGESIRYYEAALKVDPFNRSAYNALAYAYDNIGDREKAILTVNRYIEIAPDEANPYDTRGDLFLHHNEIDAALASYLQALRIKPDHFASLQTCGQLYLLKHDFGRADSCYRALALQGDPVGRAFRREFLAYVPLLQGHFARTLALLDSLSAIDMSDRSYDAAARKQFMKARVLSELGRHDEAITTVENCLHFGEPIPPAATLSCRTELVQTLVNAGRIEKAEAALELIRAQSMADSSLPWNYWFLRGYIDFNQDRTKSSIKAFGEVDPGSPPFPIRYWLARAYLADAQLSRASEGFEAIWGDYSSERFYYGLWFVKVHYYLGRVYEESRWTDKAISQYEAFLSWWGEADTDLYEITDARARLTRLRERS